MHEIRLALHMDRQVLETACQSEYEQAARKGFDCGKASACESEAETSSEVEMNQAVSMWWKN